MKKLFVTTTLVAALGSGAYLYAGSHHSDHAAHHDQHHGHEMPGHEGKHAQHAGNADKTDYFAAANQRMMDDMHSLEMTGDVDYDFIRGMKPHHQGAIEMAEVLLANSEDDNLRSMAHDIIRAQKKEIAQMQEWLQELGEPKPGEYAAEIKGAWERINERMMKDMHQAPSGKVERDFVRGMIPHHEAAIDMAYVLLSFSEHTELRETGFAVIREQKREVREMRDWLQENE